MIREWTPELQRQIIRRSKAEKEKVADDKAEAKVAPLPPPEITSTPIDVKELRTKGCSSAAGTLTAALRAGWTAEAYFSRGPRIGADGIMLDIRNCIGIRGQRGEQVFVALWLQDLKPSGKKNAYAWKINFILCRDGHLNSDGLKAYLQEDENVE